MEKAAYYNIFFCYTELNYSFYLDKTNIAILTNDALACCTKSTVGLRILQQNNLKHVGQIAATANGSS